jgi:hypothetical protein
MQITTTSPTADVVWGVGSTQTINWSSIGITGNVNIKLSIDGGSTYPLTLDTGTQNDGIQKIIVPNNPTTQARIKVESTTKPDVFGLNPGIFSIVISLINISSPIADAKWPAKSQQIISWTKQGIIDVKLELSTDGGSSWSIIDNSVNADLSNYPWTVPNVISSQAKIRISDLNTTGAAGLSETFNLIGILLSVPNGGQSWPVDSYKNITWNSVGVTNVKLEYTSNNGASWYTIIPSTPASTKSYDWKVPNTPSTQCRIRISDASNPSITNQSTSSFSIISSSTGIENIIGENDIQVYPNPTSLEIKVEYKLLLPIGIKIGIYTMRGLQVKNVIFDENVGTKSHSIDISFLEPGMYILKIESELNGLTKQIKSLKFIKN